MIKKKQQMSSGSTRTLPTKQQSQRPTREAPPKRNHEEEDEEEQGESSTHSLAGRFKAIVKAFSSNASDIPPGLYEAVISEAILQPPDTKGQSVRLKFELCSSDFEGQNIITQWFKIFDVEGEPASGGIKSLAYNFARLGVEFSFEGLDTKEEIIEHIEEILAGISEERPGIIAKVTNNAGNDGRIFTNVSVEKPCDNDLVQEYKDNVAY